MKHRGRRTAAGSGAAALLGLLGLALAAGAAPANAPADSPNARWVEKDLTFRYQGFTTKYSCAGLQSRMRSLLTRLGARADLEVRTFGCSNFDRPEDFPGVTIRMHVLEPADAATPGALPARWTAVDLLAGRGVLSAEADCELVWQLKEQVMPLFAARNLDYSASCVKHSLTIGATRLRAEVLTAAAAEPPAH